jgi:hypothetical protein
MSVGIVKGGARENKFAAKGRKNDQPWRADPNCRVPLAHAPDEEKETDGPEDGIGNPKVKNK